MRPTEFTGQNRVYAKDQQPYRPLPAFTNERGDVVSCWALTWSERLVVLFTGRVWLTVKTFNKPLQPQRLTARAPQ
jgi:hypothetical protein